jgi:hypothetical protein
LIETINRSEDGGEERRGEVWLELNERRDGGLLQVFKE